VSRIRSLAPHPDVHRVCKLTSEVRIVDISSRHASWRIFVFFSKFTYFFTARRYASAAFAVAVCPSVCPSVTSRYCIETTGRISLVLGIFLTFLFVYTFAVARQWKQPGFVQLPKLLCAHNIPNSDLRL